MTDRGVSTPIAEDWRHRADCKGDPLAFDLDALGHNNNKGIEAALHRCRHVCPVFDHCRRHTNQLPRAHQPVALVQAGEVWHERPGRNKRRGGR